MIDAKLYPYMKIDINSVTINLDKIKIKDLGDHLIKIQLINSDLAFTEYSFTLKITKQENYIKI